MDTNENQEFDPMTNHVTPDPEPENGETAQAPVQAETEQEIAEEIKEPGCQTQQAEEGAPEPEVKPETGAYRGAGVGKKESPYASSPYYSYREIQENRDTGYIPNTQSVPNYQQPPVKEEPKEEQPSKPEQKQKKPRKGLKRVAAAVLALAVLAGACAMTASKVNDIWEDKMDQMETEFEQKLEQLQIQVDALESNQGSIVISGSSLPSGDAMTPSQVYAQNVNSVVIVTGYVTSGNGYKNSVTAYSTGSGFVISEDGYVVTNYHVVQGAEKLTITTYSGEELEATLMGYDSINDVAVLDVDAQGMSYAEMGSSSALNVGDMVVAVGNALGELTYTMTVGYVSGMDRSVSTDGTAINMLQTDAAINSGNSGGPLFNMYGQVVGITTAKYSGETSSGASIEGIGFAIPINDVASMIDDLINYGYVTNQAYLGVLVKDLDSTTASYYSLPTGSYVQSVVEGGSADRAGVQAGDIIIRIGGYDVIGNSTLQTVLRKFSAGDTTTITVYRAGATVTLDITFDERPADLDSESTGETESNEMPESGDYQEWYDYFFGQGGND